MSGLDALNKIVWNINDPDLEGYLALELPDEDRELSYQEFINYLSNITMNWDHNFRDPGIVTFLYYGIDENGPEEARYSVSSLRTGLDVVGAIADYYKQDVASRLTEEEKENIRNSENWSASYFPMYLLLGETKMFGGLNSISLGVYQVNTE